MVVVPAFKIKKSLKDLFHADAYYAYSDRPRIDQLLPSIPDLINSRYFDSII